MASNVLPGLFDLIDLPINKKDLNKDAVRRKLVELTNDLKSRGDRPEELAILNVIGVLHYRLEKYKDAEEAFRSVLQKDEHNLNALANLQHVLENVYRLDEAQSVQDDLDELMRSSNGAGSDVRGLSICLAEQAYAYASDIHTEKDMSTKDRYIKSNVIFQEALDLAGDRVELWMDTDFWKFCMAKNAHKIFDKLSYGGKYSQGEDYMKTAVSLFHEITQRVRGDGEYKWECWRHLGDIFRKIKDRKHCPTPKLPPELKPYISDPEECMKKARQISPNNARLLARYANFVYSLRRNTQEAVQLLDKSIGLDSSDYNFYAFSTRGQIRLKHYKWKKGTSESNEQYSPPDGSSLLEAKDDLEQAIKFRNTAWDLKNMAEVYHLLALRSVEDSDNPHREYLEKEFEYLKRAENCEDGNALKDVKRSLGRCLYDLGEYRRAVEYFKNAWDLESPNSKYTGYFHELFRAYLCLLRSDPEEVSRRALKEEIVTCLKKAVTKYGTSALILHSLGTLRADYAVEFQQLIDYCSTIGNNEGLLYVLTTEDPPSPVAPPARQGGMLQDAWQSSKPKQRRTPKAGGSKGAAGSSGVSSTRSTPSASEGSSGGRPADWKQVGGSNESAAPGVQRTTADGASSLLSGIGDMSIKDPSSEISLSSNKAETESATMEFHFNVVYSDADRDWVDGELLPAMKARKLVGSTRHNDAVPGKYVVKNDMELIKRSACILFVIGQQNSTSECEFWLNQTLTAKKQDNKPLIPIRRGGSEVPPELKDMVTCLELPISTTADGWDKLADCIKGHIFRAEGGTDK